jgi:hypothetical protein
VALVNGYPGICARTEKGGLVGVVVVGIDGSEGAAYALDYAIKEAAAHGHRMRLVSAWEIPASVLTSGVASREFYEEFEKQAAKAAREAALRVAELEPSVRCEEVVVEGQAAKALLAGPRPTGRRRQRRRARPWQLDLLPPLPRTGLRAPTRPP